MKEYSLYIAAKSYVEERPPEEIGPLKPGDIAKKYNVSVSYLSRTFRKYSSVTLQEYLDMCLMLTFHDVVYRLEKPNLKETLERMNIKNTNYFIRKYKKRYSSTPGAFCKNQREARKKKRKKEHKK